MAWLKTTRDFTVYASRESMLCSPILTSHKFIFLTCLIQMVGTWVHRGNHGVSFSQKKDTVIVATVFGIV